MDLTMTLAAIPADPALQALQFSPDGQVLLATRSALYILTPDLGVNFDASSTAKIATGNFGWFRAVIDVGDLPPPNWFVETQEWAAVALGSIERTLRSIAVSPAFVTTNGGSVIAILTSDMTLTLWTAPRNHIRGGWNKVIDVVHILRDALKTTQFVTPLAHTLQLQATSIAWSPQPTLTSSSGSLNSGSLLAVGTRAGSVHLLRYMHSTDRGESVKLVSTLEVGDRWVTQCAWASWKASDAQTVVSTLACGLSNGDVILLDVTQTLPSGSPFNLEVATEIRNEKAASPDKRIITAMKWVSRQDGTQTLVYCKPGTAHVFTSPSPNALWLGLVDVRLQNQKTSRNSSELHPCCGIEHNQETDSVVLAVADGSLHVVGDLGGGPKYVNSAESSLSSHGLSALARNLFLKNEGGGTTDAVTCRISGMTSIRSGSVLLWLFEAVRPSDFSYKHRADRSINLALTPISGLADADESMPGGLRTVLDAPPTGQLPVASLFPTFLYLHNLERLKKNLGRTLELLKSEEGGELAAPDISCPSDPFQRHFETLLYGDQGLNGLRMKLCVADFCWKWLNGVEDLQKLCGEAAVLILGAISRRTFLVYLMLGLTKASSLTAGDCVFLRRVILQTRSDGESQLLQSKALELERLLQTMPIAGELPLEEECPACKSEIPFRDVRTAACQNGHPWTRCSVTTLVLATSQVRTCLGCTRKAFSPIRSGSGGHPSAVAESQLVAGVLQAATRCLFCGNRFVYLL